MTPSDASLTKLLRKGWRGDTASDLMAEAADRIEALVEERDEFKRLFSECHRVHLDGVQRAHELAAVLEKVRDLATMGTQYVDDPVDGERIIMLDPKLVLDAISAAPAATLREVKAQAWREGWDASERFGYLDGVLETPLNPYLEADDD